MRDRRLAFACSTAVLLAAQPAAATDDLEVATNAIEIACRGVVTQTEIEQSKLAEITLVLAGLQPSELLRLVARQLEHSPSDAELAASSLALVRDSSMLPKAVADKVDAITATFADNLSAKGGLLVKKLVVRGIKPDQSPFDAGLVLICPGNTDPNQIDGAIVSPKEEKGNAAGARRFVLRQKLEDATVDAKDASGGFQLSYARDRTTDLKGETTWTRTWAVRGVAGWRVLGDVNNSYLFAYGDYALSQVRKRSSPTPTPDEKNGSKDDVNALELGLYGSVPIGLGDSILRSSGRFGYVIDFEHKSRRLVGGLRVQPVLDDVTIGPKTSPLCGFGFYQGRIFGLPYEARCTVAFRVEASEVLKVGTSEFTAKDELLALGGEVAFEFRPELQGNAPASGIVGGVTYRYQQMVAGQAPSIDRIDITIKHRWWIDKLAIDLGLTFADGIETKSFADENKLGLTFGISF